MQNILIPIDFSDVTDAAIRTAEELAWGVGADIYVLHALTPEPAFVGWGVGPTYTRDDERKERARLLDELVKRISTDEFNVSPLLVEGPTIDAILDAIDKKNIDLVVMGSHGHGALFDLLVGSACEAVIRKAKCPVVVVPTLRKAKKTNEPEVTPY